MKLNLSQDARRQSIQWQLQEALGEEMWLHVVEEAQAAGVPNKHHHSIVEVRQTIDQLDIADETKQHMRAVYDILAAAEAQVHGCSVEETHFHEVGNGTGLLNALVICHAFTTLAPEEVTATPVQVGSGTIECAHGALDIPAPATRAILTDIPICETRLDGELCTPTSAALIKYFVDTFE